MDTARKTLLPGGQYLVFFFFLEVHLHWAKFFYEWYFAALWMQIEWWRCFSLIFVTAQSKEKKFKRSRNKRQTSKKIFAFASDFAQREGTLSEYFYVHCVLLTNVFVCSQFFVRSIQPRDVKLLSKRLGSLKFPGRNSYNLRKNANLRLVQILEYLPPSSKVARK